MNYPEAHTETKSARLPYLAGLDGLRAIAVAAVLLYHADLAWIPGGYLGVEVFFALSGYLITSLLIVEWRSMGRVDLRAFWLRRARRLLPALFLLLASVLTFAVLFLPEEVPSMRGDALAATGYVTNWYLVLVQRPYFEIVGRPPMLQHLWSLAVEEQFYLIWPVLFAGMAGRLRWRLHRGVLVSVLVGAAASAGLMALLFVPDTDPSRIYYGTDTRASGLLIGCALALAWGPSANKTERATKTKKWRKLAITILSDLSAFAALGTLALLFAQLDENEALLYQGGFLLTALATATVIAACVRGAGGLVPRLLGWAPLRWIGSRSYGIYLWHWPIYAVTRPQLDLPLDPAVVTIFQIALTVSLAELSYRLVELPIRGGLLERAWRTLRASSGAAQRRLALRRMAATGAVSMFAGWLVVAVLTASPATPPDYLSLTNISDPPSWSQSPITPIATATTATNEPPAVALDLTVTVISDAPPAPGPAPTEPPGLATQRPILVQPTATATPTESASPTPLQPTATNTVLPSPTSVPTIEAPTPRKVATRTPTPRKTARKTFTPSPSPQPTATQQAPEAIPSATPANIEPAATPSDGQSQPTSVPTTDPLLPPVTGQEGGDVTSGAEPNSDLQGGSVGSVIGPEETATATPTDAAQATGATRTVTAPGHLGVFALGDSVMLGAASELRRQIPGISISAAVGRQTSDGLNVLRSRAAAGLLGDVVVIHLGSNGYFSAKEFDDIMKVLGSVRLVVFVNDKVPRRWESSNNDVIAGGVRRYTNAALVDWHAYTANRPELFAKDGFHVQPSGARLYAQLIAAAVSGR